MNPKNPKSESIKPGDMVTWKTSQGVTQGKVKRELTRPMDIKGHHVAASKDNPQMLVESTKSGAVAAHKPAALKKSKTTVKR